MEGRSPTGRDPCLSRPPSRVLDRSVLDAIRGYVVSGWVAQKKHGRTCCGGNVLSLFITGSESFIGRVLRAQCNVRGVEVIGVDSVAPDDDVSKKGDIRDPAVADLIPEGAIVVHLAAVSRDPDCRANPKLAFDINVNGTL